MALDKTLEPWLRLSLLPGLGDAAFRRLLLAFGSPEQILGASYSELIRVVPPTAARTICNGGASADDLEAIAGWLDDPANRVVTLADERYPRLLLEIPDPPPLLYVKGDVRLLNRAALAVVGSRNATPQGIATAESLARALSEAGLTIVSGLALGIDAAAHRGGLAGAGRSVAVVGTGLDMVYPARNRALAHALAAEGALVSELPLGTPALGANFPRRNRLISGLARGCLVVEAAAHSGSLITARLANEQGRDVFAVPGSIHSPLSRGCHLLIKQGAKLVENADDILEELGVSAQSAAPQPPVPEVCSGTALRLLEGLGFDPCDIDTLATRCGLSAEEVTALLTELEIAGVVVVLSGGRFQRVR